MPPDQILIKFLRGARAGEELLAQSGIQNPFATLEYATAMNAAGYEVWIVGLRSAPQLDQVALALVTRGRLSVELELPSLPRAAQDPAFWSVVDDLCRQAGVTDVLAESYNSMPFQLPPLSGEVDRSLREEFVLHLAGCDLALALSSNHKRNIKKAKTAGVNIRRSCRNLEWLAEHAALMSLSMERRSARGESVSLSTDTTLARCLLESGAAELFQAVVGTTVLSSVLVLMAPRAGYYHSAGSSPDGMSVGASHFLLHSISGILKQEGRLTFNLGGAEAGSSLARFKLGFGPSAVVLPKARRYVGPAWKRKVRSAFRLLRSDRQRLLRIVTGSSSRVLVFRCDTAPADPAIVPPAGEVRFEALSEKHLSELPTPPDDSDFRARQLNRLSRFGSSYAFALYIGDLLAHIAWLLPAAAVRQDIPRVLSLREDEAEITGCETLSNFRGKGVYPYVIQRLVSVARQRGIRRIYMKTLETNVSSQKGIKKAGLTAIGYVDIIQPPLVPFRTIVRRKLHNGG